MLAHLLEREVPVVFVGDLSIVRVRVLVTSGVAKPDIVARINGLESRGNISIMSDPTVS